ncbi:phosphotransferase [Terasakiella sp. SH-1]|uniref:phosphotransferase n=1 Tax=Terasakiella sp. SH-1 TaxID=2560057 RepID=UPI001073BA51|nr:phosphotransferase [Terasakiella sp. SH-1]
MSSMQLPRPPALNGLHTTEYTFILFKGEILDEIKKVTGLFDSKFFILSTCQNNKRLFLKTQNLDGSSIFLKTVENRFLDQYIKSDQITLNLADSINIIIKPISGYPKPLGTTHHIFAYPFYSLSILSNSEIEFFRLGCALSELHYALKSMSDFWNVSVKKNSQRRYRKLYERSFNLKRVSRIGRDIILNALLDFDRKSLIQSFDNAQIIHGDLNSGNIGYSKQQSSVFFLDFEDTLCSYLPPEADIAFILERLIFVHPYQNKRELIKAFFKGYCGNEYNLFKGKHSISFWLSFLNLRSMLLLAEMEANNHQVSATEWTKFDTLFKQSKKFSIELEKHFS